MSRRASRAELAPRAAPALALVVACALASGCVTTERLLGRLDAEGEAEVEAAVREASAVVADGSAEPGLRAAGAVVLGRFARAEPEAVAALSGALLDVRVDAEVRAWAAWALGRMRAEVSLEPLLAGLGASLDARTGYHVLEGLARHMALIEGREERMLRAAEGMSAFASRQRGKLPSIYDLVGARVRTLPVAVKILDKAAAAAERAPNEERLADVYQAAFEVFELIDLHRAEIAAAPSAWREQLRASVEATRRTLRLEDRALTVMVLAYLGRLGDLPELATPAAAALVGTSDALLEDRPTLSRRAATRLVAAWAMSRMMAHASGPRRVLASDVLAHEHDPEVLRLTGDCGGTQDQLQTVLGIAP